MFGADYTRGPLTVGLSVGRTIGLGGYYGRSAGRMTTSMTGFHSWLGYQLNDRVDSGDAPGLAKLRVALVGHVAPLGVVAHDATASTRLPRRACSRSIASKSALKFP